jgi:hypothetical protein
MHTVSGAHKLIIKRLTIAHVKAMSRGGMGLKRQLNLIPRSRAPRKIIAETAFPIKSFSKGHMPGIPSRAGYRKSAYGKIEHRPQHEESVTYSRVEIMGQELEDTSLNVLHSPLTKVIVRDYNSLETGLHKLTTRGKKVLNLGEMSAIVGLEDMN